jgi:hypothetical protein
MSQFFCCNNCILLCKYQGDNIHHLCNRIKNRFKKIEFIKDLSNNNLVSPQKKYFFYKLFCKRNIFFTDIKSRYFCQINNKNGIVKTIFDNTTLKELVSNEKTINITNKLDGLFGTNIITKIKLMNKKEDKKIDIFNYLLNIDRNIHITLENILNIYNISYKKYDTISIEYTCTITFEDMIINSDLNDFLYKNVHEIL